MDFEKVEKWLAPDRSGAMRDVRLVTNLSGCVMWPVVLAANGTRDKITTCDGDYIRIWP